MSEPLCSNEQLQEWVERVSMSAFGWPFLHRVRFNRRLRRAGGRYDLRSHDIEINPAQLYDNGAEEVERIIKHELCHYHLHLQGRGYRHRDRDFKQLLAAVGGTRFCRPLTSRVKRGDEVNGGVAVRPLFRYLLKCRTCAQEYPRRIRCNPARYVCRRCRGSLELFELRARN